MNKITIDGNTYTLDKKTLKTSQNKLKALKSQNGVSALAIYVAIIFFVFGVWVLGYQTIMWLKTSEWLYLPWYQTIFKTEPTLFQSFASISLSLIFIIMSPVSYYLLKTLLPKGSLKENIQHLENVVDIIGKELK